MVQGQPGLEPWLWVLTRALANRPLWLVSPLERLYGQTAKEKESLALCSLGSIWKNRQCIVCLSRFHLLSFYLPDTPFQPCGIISLFLLHSYSLSQTQRLMTLIITLSPHLFSSYSLLCGGLWGPGLCVGVRGNLLAMSARPGSGWRLPGKRCLYHPHPFLLFNF